VERNCSYKHYKDHRWRGAVTISKRQGQIEGRQWIGWLDTLPFGEAKYKKMKKTVNNNYHIVFLAEIKANTLDGCLTVISTLWHC